MTPPFLRIGFLHFAPVPGRLSENQTMIEQGVSLAAEAGAQWILTPELAVCGYGFAPLIGTEWIARQPDAWLSRMGRLAAHYRVTLFLSAPERAARTARLHNSLFVLGSTGTILGLHRKIHTLRVGSESWSTPGRTARPISVPPYPAVGLLICADASTPQIAGRLRAQGARCLVSAAAWAPGHHGPNGEWERCTRQTGLPLFVCNRTGPDTTLDFTAAESVVAHEGRRLLAMTSTTSAVFLVDWDLHRQALHSTVPERIPL